MGCERGELPADLDTDEVRDAMRAVLGDIRSGAFAKQFLLDDKVGQPTLKTGRRNSAESQVAKVGSSLRKMMPFIGAKEEAEEGVEA